MFVFLKPNNFWRLCDSCIGCSFLVHRRALDPSWGLRKLSQPCALLVWAELLSTCMSPEAYWEIVESWRENSWKFQMNWLLAVACSSLQGSTPVISRSSNTACGRWGRICVIFDTLPSLCGFHESTRLTKTRNDTEASKANKARL